MNPPSGNHFDLIKISRARALFGIDARSLAVFRIAIGILLLIDLAIRIGDLHSMYSDQGVMPATVVHDYFSGTWRWSLYWIHSSTFFQATLFLIAALLATALLAGFYTRLATIGSWIFLASIYTRAPFAVNGGDTLLLVLLFWAMFLPLDRCWSLDARLGRNRMRFDKDYPVVLSMGTCSILIQIFMVYFFTALFKCIYHQEVGQLLQGTLIWGDYNRPLGNWLAQYPVLMQIISLGTIGFELLAPLLLFIPWRTSRFRLATLAGLLVLHLGIDLTITVGMFSYISLAGCTLFLPTQFWSATCWDPLRRFFKSSSSTTNRSPDSRQIDKNVRQRELPLLVEGICAALLLFVITYNIFGLVERGYGRITPPAMKRTAELLMLNQKWSMFASLQHRNMRFVAHARLADGREVDLLREEKPLGPPTKASKHPNHRWVKYLQGIGRSGTPDSFRKIYAAYLFHRWNVSHPEDERIQKLELRRFRKIISEEEIDHYGMDTLAVIQGDNQRIEETIEWTAPWRAQ